MDIERRAFRHDVGIYIAFLFPLVVRLRVADIGVGNIDVTDTSSVSAVVSCRSALAPSIDIIPCSLGMHFLREV